MRCKSQSPVKSYVYSTENTRFNPYGHQFGALANTGGLIANGLPRIVGSLAEPNDFIFERESGVLEDMENIQTWRTNQSHKSALPSLFSRGVHEEDSYLVAPSYVVIKSSFDCTSKE